MLANSNPESPGPRLVLVMGVSGSGKSTVGHALAEALGVAFLEADDFHPPANVGKMSRGEPLTDADRLPWLDAMNRVLRDLASAGRGGVLACSALKARYRDRLFAGVSGERHVVYLRGDAQTLLARMRSRDHFMPPSLLESQLDTLEPPADAIVADICEPVGAIVASLVRRLGGEF